MDFSYFTSAPQPYQFFGLSHTPSNNHAPTLDDFNPNASNVSTSLDVDLAPLTVSQDQYDSAFAAFQQNFHYDPSTFLAQPHQPNNVSPPLDVHQDSMLSIPDGDSKGFTATVAEVPAEETVVGRSSSEEKDLLTPQQNKRKAQNRAA